MHLKKIPKINLKSPYLLWIIALMFFCKYLTSHRFTQLHTAHEAKKPHLQKPACESACPQEVYNSRNVLQNTATRVCNHLQALFLSAFPAQLCLPSRQLREKRLRDPEEGKPWILSWRPPSTSSHCVVKSLIQLFAGLLLGVSLLVHWFPPEASRTDLTLDPTRMLTFWHWDVMLPTSSWRITYLSNKESNKQTSTTKKSSIVIK